VHVSRGLLAGNLPDARALALVPVTRKRFSASP
jgi:hypothetical protein